LLFNYPHKKEKNLNNNRRAAIKLREIGETGLIKRIKKKFADVHVRNRKIVVGIGDDAAVIDNSGKNLLVVTTDTLVEGVHFIKGRDYHSVGWRAMTANLSDIAAMGGKPEFALVSLALPVSSCVELVDKLYRGMRQACGSYRVHLIGGDTVKSTRNLVITLTLIGSAARKRVITRAGAKIGDKLLITGTAGDSEAGLYILKNMYSQRNRKIYGSLIRKHARPVARLKQSEIIAKKLLATSMMDSSDGLDVSVRTICAESRVGAKIYADMIPVSAALKKFAGSIGKRTGSRDELCYAVYGGEDFELVFTVPAEKLRLALKSVPGTSVIGDIVEEKKGVEYFKNGRSVKIEGRSYRHF